MIDDVISSPPPPNNEEMCSVIGMRAGQSSSIAKIIHAAPPGMSDDQFLRKEASLRDRSGIWTNGAVSASIAMEGGERRWLFNRCGCDVGRGSRRDARTIKMEGRRIRMR